MEIEVTQVGEDVWSMPGVLRWEFSTGTSKFSLDIDTNHIRMWAGNVYHYRVGVKSDGERRLNA
jgi:hypothetical protein